MLLYWRFPRLLSEVTLMFICLAAATFNWPEVSATSMTMITWGVYFLSEKSMYHALNIYNYPFSKWYQTVQDVFHPHTFNSMKALLSWEEQLLMQISICHTLENGTWTSVHLLCEISFQMARLEYCALACIRLKILHQKCPNFYLSLCNASSRDTELKAKFKTKERKITSFSNGMAHFKLHN